MREGFLAEIFCADARRRRAPFGLFLAFVIIVAYQNCHNAGSDISRETESLSAIIRDSTAFPQPEGDGVRHAVGT